MPQAIEPPQKGQTRQLFKTAFKDFKELSSDEQEVRKDSNDKFIEERKKLREETKKLEHKSLRAGVRRLFNKQDEEQEEEDVKSKKKPKRNIQPDDDFDEHIKISIPGKKVVKKSEEVDTEEDEEEDDEDEISQDEEEEQAKEVKKPKKDEEDKEEEVEDTKEDLLELTDEEKAKLEEIEKLDEENLLKQDGSKASPATVRDFKKLKKILRNTYRSLNAARRSSKVDPQVHKQFEELKKAHTELKTKYDTAFFQETPEWIDSYEVPVKKANDEMVQWLDSHEHGPDSDELQQMEIHINEIQKALHSGNKVKYYEEVDNVADFLKKGASTRFRSAAPDLWRAHEEKVNAFKDKKKASETVVSKFRTVALDRAKEVSKVIDASIADFEDRNKIIVNAYKNDDRLKAWVGYDDIVTKKKDDVKKHIETALVNRQITPELMTVINQGILYELSEKEKEGLRERIRLSEETIERLEKKLGIKEKTLKKVTPSSRARRDDDDDDEEEDEDKPKSMKELFLKRRQEGLV